MSRASDMLGGLLTDLTIEKAKKDFVQQKKDQMTQGLDVPQEKDEEEQKDENESDNDSDGGDFSLERLRAQRILKMKELSKAREERRIKGHGKYEEIDEENFLKACTGSKYCVVHFYLDSFERCKILDMHYRKIAPQLEQTRFVKLNADKAPFFVSKLQIRTLPTSVCFVDGVSVRHLVGLEGLRGDVFPTKEFVELLTEVGVCKDKYVEHGDEAGVSSEDE